MKTYSMYWKHILCTCAKHPAPSIRMCRKLVSTMSPFDMRSKKMVVFLLMYRVQVLQGASGHQVSFSYTDSWGSLEVGNEEESWEWGMERELDPALCYHEQYLCVSSILKCFPCHRMICFSWIGKLFYSQSRAAFFFCCSQKPQIQEKSMGVIFWSSTKFWISAQLLFEKFEEAPK